MSIQLTLRWKIYHSNAYKPFTAHLKFEGENNIRCCLCMLKSIGVHHLKMKRDENDNRESFTFSEAVALGVKIEEEEKKKARARQATSSGGKILSFGKIFRELKKVKLVMW